MISFYVYVVQEVKASRTAPIKIGVTNDTAWRMSALQNGNPRKLEYRLLFGPMSRSAAFDFEGHLQSCLREFCLRNEWFSGKAMRKLLQHSKEPTGASHKRFVSGHL